MLNWLLNIWSAVRTVAEGLVVTLRSWLVTYKQGRGAFTQRFEYPERPVMIGMAQIPV